VKRREYHAHPTVATRREARVGSGIQYLAKQRRRLQRAVEMVLDERLQRDANLGSETAR
jgi:hypothetical protein